MSIPPGVLPRQRSLDAAQAIKNVAIKRSQAAMALRGDFKLVTTGIPLENHLGELWNLFLISLRAGGVGLNLTAANYVIHMDPWWNPAVEDQASDRAHRIGQQRLVTIYRLVAKDTIEEKIVALHHQKRDLADSLLEGTEMSGQSSPEELLRLLKEGQGDRYTAARAQECIAQEQAERLLAEALAELTRLK